MRTRGVKQLHVVEFSRTNTQAVEVLACLNTCFQELLRHTCLNTWLTLIFPSQHFFCEISDLPDASFS